MAAAIVNVPFVGTMNNAGTATLQTVQQETYNFTAAADVVLSGALDADIIGAFQLSEETQTSGTVVLNVAMRNESAFKAALRNALQSVTVSTADGDLTGQYATLGAIGVDLEDYIVAWARQQIDADLTANTIGAAIEASEVESLAITDFSANAFDAAGSMYSGLNSLSADVRRLVATQLPSSRFPETFSDALPLVSGDQMVFRFNVNPSITVSENPQDLGGAADGGASGSASAGAGPGVGVGYGVDARVIELVLTKA
jgi:hypothetical protein